MEHHHFWGAFVVSFREGRTFKETPDGWTPSIKHVPMFSPNLPFPYIFGTRGITDILATGRLVPNI